MSRNSERLLSESPIFMDALAAATHSQPADAAEHFDSFLGEGQTQYVISEFLSEYAGPPVEEEPSE